MLPKKLEKLYAKQITIKTLIAITLVVMAFFLVRGCTKTDQQKIAKRIYPFVHLNCKEYHDNADYTLVCETCKIEYNKWGDIEIGKIMKKWKEVKGYEFGKGDFLSDVQEMTQIIVNRKLEVYH